MHLGTMEMGPLRVVFSRRGVPVAPPPTSRSAPRVAGDPKFRHRAALGTRTATRDSRRTPVHLATRVSVHA